MCQVVTVREAVARMKADGFGGVTEHCLRRWIAEKVIPVRTIGRKSLIFYPTLIEYIKIQQEDKEEIWSCERFQSL